MMARELSQAHVRDFLQGTGVDAWGVFGTDGRVFEYELPGVLYPETLSTLCAAAYGAASVAAEELKRSGPEALEVDLGSRNLILLRVSVDMIAFALVSEEVTASELARRWQRFRSDSVDS